MNTPNKMNREYRINAGNSSTGPIGFVLHTKAESPEAALAWAKQQLSDKTYAHDITESQTGELSIVYIYTNPQALTLADVWDVETDRCCAPEAEHTPAPSLKLEQARQAYKQGTKNVCEALDKFVAGQTDKAGIESEIAAMALAETNFLEAARKGQS